MFLMALCAAVIDLTAEIAEQMPMIVMLARTAARRDFTTWATLGSGVACGKNVLTAEASTIPYVASRNE